MVKNPKFGGGGGLTQPGFGGKSSGAGDNGKGSHSTAPDKSGFGGSNVDPGLRTPFVDAVTTAKK